MHKYGASLILLILAVAAAMTFGSIYFHKQNTNQFAFEKEEELDTYEKVEHYIYLAISNLVLISHALPSSIYIAIEILRFYHKRGLIYDMKLISKQINFFTKISGLQNLKKE